MSESRRPVWKRLVLPLVIAVIAASSILGYAYATGRLTSILSFGPGKQPPVVLQLVNYTISYDQNQQNPTVATIWVQNSGTSSGTVASLIIQNAGSNGAVDYSSHPNQTIGSHGARVAVVIDTLGSGFYFSHGGDYYVNVTADTGFQLGFHMTY